MKAIGRQPSAILCFALSLFAAASAGPCWRSPRQTRYGPHWRTGSLPGGARPHLLAYDMRATDPQVSIKDPTSSFTRGAWHLFGTVRIQSGKVDIAT